MGVIHGKVKRALKGTLDKFDDFAFTQGAIISIVDAIAWGEWDGVGRERR